MEYLTEGTSTAKVDEPKPIQKPHIPIYLGGFSPHIFTRIVNTIPLAGQVESVDPLENHMKMIKENASMTNKDPKSSGYSFNVA